MISRGYAYVLPRCFSESALSNCFSCHRAILTSLVVSWKKIKHDMICPQGFGAEKWIFPTKKNGWNQYLATHVLPLFRCPVPLSKMRRKNLPDYLGMPVSPSGYSPFILFHLGPPFWFVYRLWPLCSLYPHPRRLKCSDQWTLPLLGCQAETWRRRCPTWRLFNAL